jgi:hypothetical protein
MTPDCLILAESYIVHYQKDFPVQVNSLCPCPIMSYFVYMFSVSYLTLCKQSVRLGCLNGLILYRGAKRPLIVARSFGPCVQNCITVCF